MREFLYADPLASERSRNRERLPSQGAGSLRLTGRAAKASVSILAITAAYFASASSALAIDECGALVAGAIDCKTTAAAAVAAGITYVDPAAVTINLQGGLAVVAAPAAAVTATAGANATVNAAGGFTIIAAGGAGYLITGGLNATANLSAGSNIVLVGGAGVVVNGGLNATVNAATGSNIFAAGGAGYVVTSVGVGPAGGAIVNVGGETNAGGAGIIATSLAGFANVTTASTSQINAGGAGIIASGGFSTQVSTSGAINAGGAGIIASVVGSLSAISKVSVSVGGQILAAGDGVIASSVFADDSVKVNSTIAAASGNGVLFNAASGGSVSAVVNATITAGTSALNVNAVGSASNVSLVVQNAGSLQAGGDAIFVNTAGTVSLNQDGAIKSTGGNAINVANATDISLLLQASVSGATNGVIVNGSGNISINQDNLGPITATGLDGITAGSSGGTVSIVQNGKLSVGRDGLVVTGTAGTSMSTITANVAFNAPRNAILATGITGPLTINTNAALSGAAGRGIDFAGTGAGAATLNVNAGLTGGLAGIRVDTVAASTINIGLNGNLSAGNDLAVETPTGPITINNAGIVTGFVQLASGADRFNNNASATWFTHTAGTTGSTSIFGPGNDVLFNSGRLVAARSGSIQETVVFSGLANFVNGDPTGVGPGLITMQDGTPNDTLSTTGNFTGVGNSTLAVDTFLGPPGSTSDRLVVGGNVGGITLVKVNDVNPGPGAFNPVGITVVSVQGTGSNNFRVDPTSVNYINFGPLGAINKGFFVYPLLYDPDPAYKFFGLPGPFAFNMPVAHTGAQSIFQETADVWEDRQIEVRNCMRHGLSAAAAGPSDGVDVEPLPPGAAGPVVVKSAHPPLPRCGGGIWTKVVGGYATRTDKVDLGTAFGPQFAGLNFDNSYRQSTGAVISGFDFGKSELTSPFDSLVFSLMGGYIESFLNFNSNTNANFNNVNGPNGFTSFTYSGATVAGSASYTNRGFFIDALLKADFLTLNVGGIPGAFCMTGGFATCGQSVKATTWGAVGNVGYRVELGRYFVEPLASISWNRNSIGSLNLPGAAVVVQFGGVDDLDVGGGLRAGGVLMDGKVHYLEASVTNRFWDRASGNNPVNFANLGPTFELTDKFPKAYGESAVQLDWISRLSGWSAFATMDTKFNTQFQSYTGKVGGRYQF